MPFLEPLIEILRNDVTRNAGESHRALAPSLESEVKLVVLDPLNASDAVLCERY